MASAEHLGPWIRTEQGSAPGVSALRHPPAAAGVEDAERWKGVGMGKETLKMDGL